MESTSNLTSLPEETSEQNKHSQSPKQQSPSAFASASIPDRPPVQKSSEKFSPIDWNGYFDEERDVTIPDSDNVFHVYMAGTEGPVVFCLHGGGYSGLSFAVAARIIKEKARVVAMDLRGHGKTSSQNDIDLSIETMCNDVVAVVKALYGDSSPAIILVGHSMGGSVAVHVAAKKVLSSLAGLVVVDVVEGTAIASLIHMQKILSSRMKHFSSLEKAVQLHHLYCLYFTEVHVFYFLNLSLCSLLKFDCEVNLEIAQIEWSVKGGTLRNVDSARISIPSTLKFDESKNCYIYQSRLEETEQYWRGWYEGLSEKFLSSPVPKLLLLAGTDRLDKTLTIGQMQGKFQLVVVPHTGHAIQEDVPDEFASLILNFISRNRIGPHGVEIPGLRRPLPSQS